MRNILAYPFQSAKGNAYKIVKARQQNKHTDPELWSCASKADWLYTRNYNPFSLESQELIQKVYNKLKGVII